MNSRPENEKVALLLLESELLIDSLPQGRNFVHYDFLKLRYIRGKMTDVGQLAVVV